MKYEWIYKTGQVTRNGVMINRGKFMALARLVECKERGMPWQEIKGVQQRNLKGLQMDDLIVKSVGKDGIKYCVTGRGEALLKRLAVRSHRRDGICPKCEDKPKRRNKGYCLDCEKERAMTRYYDKKAQGKTLIPEGKCRLCEEPRYKTQTGMTYYPYCEEHAREYVRNKSRLYRERLREAAVLTKRCHKCGEPAHVSNRDVYWLCTFHYKEYLKMRTARYKKQKLARIIGFYKGYSTKGGARDENYMGN